MITKMLIEIFQAIIEDPTVRRLLGNIDPNKRHLDLETLMDELDLNAEERKKFREAYKDYQQDPYASYEHYKYKYEPKSSSPFDKFDAYFNKYDDWAKEADEKYGKGAGDWSHRKYQKYYNYGKGGGGFTSPSEDAEAKKHYETLEVSQSASFEEIKAAYKKAMKKYHPDKFSDPEKKKHAESISRKINVAYDYFKKKFNKS